MKNLIQTVRSRRNYLLWGGFFFRSTVVLLTLVETVENPFHLLQ